MKTLTEVEHDIAINLAIQYEENGLFDYDYWEGATGEIAAGIERYEGATRICIISEELPNWVLKVDTHKGRTSYTEREAENYYDAVKEDLGGYFAATYKIYTCDDGRVVCAQERVETNEEAITDSWYRYASTEIVDVEDIENEDDISDVVWDAIYNMDDYDRVEAVFNGDMMISKLHRFIRSHRINDLHEGNWGCPVDGDSDELVIMDFAGYGF